MGNEDAGYGNLENNREGLLKESQSTVIKKASKKTGPGLDEAPELGWPIVFLGEKKF